MTFETRLTPELIKKFTEAGYFNRLANILPGSWFIKDQNIRVYRNNRSNREFSPVSKAEIERLDILEFLQTRGG